MQNIMKFNNFGLNFLDSRRNFKISKHPETGNRINDQITNYKKEDVPNELSVSKRRLQRKVKDVLGDGFLKRRNCFPKGE